MDMKNCITPGYYIVQQPGTLEFQATVLFTNTRSNGANYFLQLNSDTKWVKPGQILIIASHENTHDDVAVRSLRAAKEKVNAALSTLGVDVADFLNRNYSLISSLVSWGDTIAGNAGDFGNKYFREIESILKKVEATYQSQFISKGTLISQQFFYERKALFNQLDPLLNKFSRKVIGVRDYPEIKKALGLSSKSIVHEWRTVGVGGIPGYATYIDKAARAAEFMKIGGWLSLAFSFAETSNDVFHACTTGRESECNQVAIKKYSSFVGGVAGAALGGVLASSLVGPVCLAVGVPTMGIGTAVCGITVGLVMTSSGTWLGNTIGGYTGDGVSYLIYGGN